MSNRSNNIFLQETHSRQLDAIDNIILQMRYYDFFRQTHHHEFDDIMLRVGQLCHHVNITDRIDDEINSTLQSTLIGLCVLTGIPWINIDNKLNIIYINLNRHVEKVIRLVNEHYHRIQEEEERRLIRNIKMPNPTVLVIPKSEINTPMNDVCGICLESHSKKDSLVCQCHHAFGTKCFKTWFKTCKKNIKKLTCPSCRQNVSNISCFRTKAPKTN